MSILDTPMNYDKSGLYLPRSARSRANVADSRRVLWQEDCTSWPPGMWNDAVGDAYLDHDIMFAGKPTYRLDKFAEQNGSHTDPGRTANTGGVVFKRRIHDGFTGQFAIDFWFRFTSTNNNGTTAPVFSTSIYNRTGTDTDGDSTAWHGRLWLYQNGNNKDIHALVLDGAATAAANAADPLNPSLAGTYTDVATSAMQNGAGTHNWEPEASSGRLDRAGGWHYAYLAVDLNTKQYVACQIDGSGVIDLSGYQLDHTTSSGFAGMHFSFEYSSNTSTNRFMNIAQITGYGS